MHTAEPWEANKLNWRNEPEPFDVYISGNIIEYEGEDGDDTYGNSATGICIVKGNATSGAIADDNAARIVACVNALAGIADPAAFMAAVRELRDENDKYFGDDFLYREAIEPLIDSLATLLPQETAS